jgi:hypothetical protein
VTRQVAVVQQCRSAERLVPSTGGKGPDHLCLGQSRDMSEVRSRMEILTSEGPILPLRTFSLLRIRWSTQGSDARLDVGRHGGRVRDADVRPGWRQPDHDIGYLGKGWSNPCTVMCDEIMLRQRIPEASRVKDGTGCQQVGPAASPRRYVHQGPLGEEIWQPKP